MTFVYHPQTDVQIKRFNQTLMQMLWQVVDEEGRNWDLLLSYFFVVWETLKASIEFTPITPFQTANLRAAGCSPGNLALAILL